MSGYVGYALKAGKSKKGQKIISKVKDFFKSRGSKVSPTIKSVETNVPKTNLEKATSKLNIAKHKTKMSKEKLNQTMFNIDQAAKKAKEVAKDKRNEKIVKKFIGEK